MKHILACVLMASFALCPMLADAQGVIGRKQKTEQPKAKPKPKPQPSKQAQRTVPKPKASSNAGNRSSHPVPNLQQELDKLASNMVYVVGGTFAMGARADDSETLYDEKPAHQVTLSSYYICKYEVTQALWKAVMGSNPSESKGDNLPVESVSWNDCQQFISKLNSLTGQHYRLPTEAEWEFAARGGNSSRRFKYCGSNILSDVAWYLQNSERKTHPVGTKMANELGLYDMSGNVCEWCSDWYGDYSSSAQTNPTGPSGEASRVYRGGGWGGDARFCRSVYRNYNAPDDRGNYLGLRLVRS